MNRFVADFSFAAAFAAGCGANQLLRPALAAEPTSGQVEAIAIMTPPQAPDGTKLLD